MSGFNDLMFENGLKDLMVKVLNKKFLQYDMKKNYG